MKKMSDEPELSLDDARAAVAQHVTWFEGLTPQSLDELPLHYRADAVFHDPFQRVQGLQPIRRVFEPMFRDLHEPRFTVTRCLVDGPQAFLVWDFHFRLRRFDSKTLQRIHGGSLWLLDGQGRITLHRDYWDAAEELYGKLPGLRWLMAWLRRRVAH